MSTSRVAEVLYDSETVLRLVDSELDELRDDRVDAHPLAVLLTALQRMNGQIASVLRAMHLGREALRGVPLEEIRESTTKLREVASATEAAATCIMDGLDRAQVMVDRLDVLADTSDSDSEVEAAAVRNQLRDELFAIMGSLQFQDITSQQLGHVEQMLADVDRRLRGTAALLDGSVSDAADIAAGPAAAFAESASTRDATERQAAADALFWAERARRAAS